MTTKNIFFAVVAVIVLVLGFALIKQKTGDETGKMSLVSYESETYRFGFEYPSGYYLKERTDVGTPNQPQLAVVLVEDTEWNRDLVEGRVMEAAEGPTAITADAYQNPRELSAREWIDESTNWTLKTNIEDVVVGDADGVSFMWDGLYAGRSVVVAEGEFIYVFGVTWMSADDQIIKDFDMVLNSATFDN